MQLKLAVVDVPLVENRRLPDLGDVSSEHFSETNKYEPTHEIMALIALRKLNLQIRMRSNPLGLHV